MLEIEIVLYEDISASIIQFALLSYVVTSTEADLVLVINL